MSHARADHCPQCAGANFQSYRLGLLQCKDCGLVVSPLIWQALANESLEDEWFAEDYQPETSVWVRWFEMASNRQTLRRVRKTAPAGRRLLEIGVGSGSLLVAAREQGFDVMGCDLSRTLCERVTHRHGIPMHCGEISALEGRANFDVVVMNHVLEHVTDPVGFLRAVMRLLAPGGVAHIAVPNVASWEAVLPGWTSYEPYHLSYFTPDTLRKVIVASGLAIQQLQTQESFSGWFLAVLRTLLGINRHGAIQRNMKRGGTLAGRQRPSVVEHIYRMAMVVAGGCLWPLRVFQARLGRGDEIVCLAYGP